MRRIVFVSALLLGGLAIFGAIGPSLTTRPTSSYPPFVDYQLQGAVERMHAAPVKDPADRSNWPTATVVIAVTGVNPSEKSVQALAKLRLYDPVLGSTVDFRGADGQSVFVDPKTRNAVRAGYQGQKVRLVIDAVTAGATEATFDFEKLATTAGFQTAKVSLPSEANPQSFPSDRYSSNIALRVYLPDGIRAVIDRGAVRKYDSSEIAVISGAGVDDHLTQWNMGATHSYVEDSSLFLNDPSNILALRIRRPLSLLFFYYSVSLAPALLGLTYFGGWLAKGNRPSTVEHSNALELGAALLALLAIRQVLVPPEISGVTLMDRLLGVQLVMIVCGMALVFARRPISPPVADVPVTTKNPWESVLARQTDVKSGGRRGGRRVNRQ